MRTKKILLIDAMALIYRAYFAFIKSPRIHSNGMNTSSVLGFANSLLEVLKKIEPTHVVVAFDTATPTFRKEMYTAYKAHREAQPEDITVAIPYIQLLLEALRIRFVEVEGYEADDIIGTLADRYASREAKVYMVTPDKDFAQLVGEHTYLYRPGIGPQTASLWREEEVRRAWGIEHPSQVVDVLGLWGDASDNIPGVPGIGPKTAQKLIRTYGSIDNLLKHKYELKGRLPRLLEEYAEQAQLSRRLAQICKTVPLSFDLDSSLYKTPDAERLVQVCGELGFRQLPKRILAMHQAPVGVQMTLLGEEVVQEDEGSSLADIKSTAHEYHCIDSVEGCEDLVRMLEGEGAMAFDTETTGLNPLEARLLGVSIAYRPHEAYYIDVNRPEGAELLKRLAPVFGSKRITKVGQHLKYDLHVLERHGVVVEGPYFDTMVAHHLLEPERRHGLNDMAVAYLGYRCIGIEILIGRGGRGVRQRCMSEVSLEELVPYACEDADITFQLYSIFRDRLKDRELIGLFERLEMPLLPVLVGMEREGVRLDTRMLKVLSKELVEEMEVLVQAVYRLADHVFNIDSPKQLGEVLFDRLKLVAKPVRTKGGQYNTSQGILGKLAGKYVIVDKVLAYRALKKLHSTYVEALPELISPEDGRLHTSYHQTHVYTGRLSSSGPNLQNIPIRTAQGRAIRRAFVASEGGYTLISADYSQIELRMMAHCARDEAMIEAFRLGRDIHAATASKMFHTGLQGLTSSMRRQAKMVNFGIIYGISAFGLAQRLEISPQEASAMIKAYFTEFPSVKHYMEEVVRQAREQGFVATLGGRRRYLPNLHSRNATIRAMNERTAINMPIQGSSAELMKEAMIATDRWIRGSGLDVKMLLQVHDELLFEVHESAVETFVKEVKPLMEQAMPLRVPVVVNIGRGSTWLEAH